MSTALSPADCVSDSADSDFFAASYRCLEALFSVEIRKYNSESRILGSFDYFRNFQN